LERQHVANERARIPFSPCHRRARLARPHLVAARPVVQLADRRPLTLSLQMRNDRSTWQAYGRCMRLIATLSGLLALLVLVAPHP
jgi:hypothetical protein